MHTFAQTPVKWFIVVETRNEKESEEEKINDQVPYKYINTLHSRADT